MWTKQCGSDVTKNESISNAQTSTSHHRIIRHYNCLYSVNFTVFIECLLQCVLALQTGGDVARQCSGGDVAKSK